VRDLTKRTGQSRSRSRCLANEHFIVEACSTCYIPGYLIVAPSDAVEFLWQMNPEALAALGPTLAMTSAAIEAVVRPQGVYCALFSEETRAVHFHLFPRTEWLTSQYFAAHPHQTKISGPRLMDWARRTFQKPIRGVDRDEIFQRIRARFRSITIKGITV
jgi:diadenosine tetraphosphate (Ap4A) HIT family hydrolase